MINVSQNNINLFVLTLRERSLIYASGGTPYYLMELKNQQTNDVTRLTLPALSSCSRYDLCKLIVTGQGQNLSAGTVTLNEIGYYDYVIYEQPVINLTTSAGYHLLEEGLLRLTGASQFNSATYNGGFNSKVFNG